MKPLIKVSLWLAGYTSLGLGLIVFIGAAKLLLDVLPELFFGLMMGIGLIVFGFWLLGQHSKLSKGRSIWQ